jgi:hypothetical protein
MIIQTHRYPSKKGFVIYVPIIIMIAVCALSIFNGEYFSALFCTALVLLIVAPMILNTNYTINEDNTLRVKCGFFVNLLIDINQIRKIEFTRSVLSSPALSLDRIEIFYNKFDSVIVSPENKLEFIAQLTGLNPAIEVKGEPK